MCTGSDLIARVACGVRRCDVGARRESGRRHGCGGAVSGAAGGRRALVESPLATALAPGSDVRAGWWEVGRREDTVVRRRTCVDAWASSASGGSFRAVAPVAVWDTARLLRGGRVIYGKVPNNANSQGSQELNTSEGTY